MTKMYRWAVALDGTKKYTNFEGYKTKKEAKYIAEEMTKLTGKMYIVIDTRK